MVAPPLLGLGHATEYHEGQDYLQFIRKNINRLVDGMTTHIEKIIGTVGRGINTAIHQSLENLDLAQLKSYLKGEERSLSLGDLWLFDTREGRCTWTCRDHIFDYHESSMRRLKYAISASGGVCLSNKVQLRLTSESTTKRLYDAIGNACRVQNVGNWPHVSLELNRHPSAMKSTSAIINSLDSLDSLSLDFDRLSMTANGISRGVVGNVALKVVRLDNLTLDDFDFIH